jgi:two-component system CheB/CheR fusion protein
MGTDGELGLKVIKEHLGLAIVQEPDSAQFNSMPLAAISTGFADYIQLPEDMPEKLISYFHHPVIRNEENDDLLDSKVQNALLKIFMLLRTQTGHDFSMYKRNTINRRIERRIAVHQLTGISEYVNYLRENAHEIDVLFKELLIGVTKFFRDADAFEALEKHLMVRLRNKKENEPFRIWIAACSTGEEAYSIAILLIECMEKLNIRNSCKAQIFATDLDAAAVEKARSGIYFDNLSGDVSAVRLKRFFIHQNNHYIVKKEVRELIIFAQHNLIRDSPFTKLDLLSCRNVLIYLNSELQKKLIPLFHYSLNKGGILFLGNSETIGSFSDLYAALDGKLRIFERKDAVSFSRIDYPFSIPRHDFSASTTQNDVLKTGKSNLPGIFQNILLERYTPPSVITNEKGDVLYVNGNLGKFAEIITGEPQMNIHKITKKPIRYEISNLISKCISSKSSQVRDGLTLKLNEKDHIIRLTSVFLKEPSPLEGLIMVIFEDLGEQVKQKLVRSGKSNKGEDIILELEKDLSRTREQLENTIQQMETSFEELMSTNEELQSTNEELQSTNEEAITSKEEMQSMNEELMTINMQYQAKSDELMTINNDMKNLMDSMEIATIFLNNDLVIKKYTPKAAEIIKLIPSDTGRSLFHLGSPLIYKNLERDMKDVVRKLTPKEITIGDKNRFYSLRITPYRTNENYIEGVVLTFIDITKLKKLEDELNYSLEYAENIINGVTDALAVTDYKFNIVSINKSFQKIFKLSRAYIKGNNLFKLDGWRSPLLKKKIEALTLKHNEFSDMPIDFKSTGSGKLSVRISGRVLASGGREKKLILLTFRIDSIKNTRTKNGKK